MLKERIATACVLLAVFLSAVFFLPTRQFALLVAGIVALGAFEWTALAKLSRRGCYGFSAACTIVFAIVVWGLQAMDPDRPEVAIVYAVSAAFWVLVAPLWLARKWPMRSRAVALAVGALIILPAGLAIVSLHSLSPAVLLMTLALVWVADIAAYFAGRRFGKHKLAPHISPGKTWEGAFGALAGTLVYATICAIASPQLRGVVRGQYWAVFFVVMALLCVVSIIGDLFESFVKRQANVKDSGTLLPGHGGVLDRIDSITSTLPLAALLFFFVTGGP